jgi:hypothetical protein
MAWCSLKKSIGTNLRLPSPERKRPLERTRGRGEENIRMDIREIVWEDVDWVLVAQDWD